MKHCFIAIFLIFSSIECASQMDTINPLPIIEVRVTKINQSGAPYSYSTVPITVHNHQATSINEYLHSMAGIFTMASTNYAQDSRITSRGFGARAAFGIRGIKILMDDLPDSSPDGQAQLDNVDFGAIRKIELLRGPQSGMYGNNSGGVLNMYSVDLNAPSYFNAKYILGEFGNKQLRYDFLVKWKKWKLFSSLSNQAIMGYREWSKYKNSIANLIINHQLSAKQNIQFNFNYATSPMAQDPGAQTLEEYDKNKRAANPSNFNFLAGEQVTQAKLGFVYKNQLSSDQALTIRPYFLHRIFENKLPFQNNGIVNIQRNQSGILADYTFSFNPINKFIKHQVGIDYENQKDRRSQYANIKGAQGEIGFDQLEYFSNASIYLLNKVNFGKQWQGNVDLRYDQVQISATDYFISNGDQSGKRLLHNANYSLAFGYVPFNNITISFIRSTGFESPTLNELSNRADDTGGFNPELIAMLSINHELNIKYKTSKLQGQLSLFTIQTENEIIAYEIPNQTGRSYYRNSGKTSRKGLELEFLWKPTQWFDGRLSYSSARYLFDEYLSFEGNRLPGLPSNVGFCSFNIQPFSFFKFNFTQRWVSQLSANDSNDTTVNGFAESNFRSTLTLKNSIFQTDLTLGCNNIINADYYSNIRINANGKRYYETALPRHFYIAISMRITGKH